MKKAGAVTPLPFNNVGSVGILDRLNFNPTSPGKLVPKKSIIAGFDTVAEESVFAQSLPVLESRLISRWEYQASWKFPLTRNQGGCLLQLNLRN